MKRYLCVWIFVLFLWPQICSGAGELLSNGDFEQWSGGLPVGWTRESTVPTVSSAAGHSQPLCAQIVRGSSTDGIIQRVPISVDEPYEFAVWANCPGMSQCGIRIQFYNVASGGSALASSDPRYNSLSGAWEKVTTGPVMPPPGSTYAQVNIRVYTTAGTTILVDDATLQQVSRDQVASARGWSTEWDATAFNGGRRLVRDADGRFHLVFHSQDSSALIPGNPPGAALNRPSGIYYTYTTRPALDQPPPLQSVDWVSPVAILGTDLDAEDDRYPSICIEYDGTTPYLNNDRIHIVWQREASDGGQYDICYATKQNEPSGTGGTWDGIRGTAFPADYWLYSSITRNSLAPVIDLAYNNVVHVAWQEEDAEEVSGSYYSEIYYKNDTMPGWLVTNSAVNVSLTPDSNSQTPSIAISVDDRYTTTYTYPSPPGDVIYLVWSDDMTAIPAASAPHIYMKRSFNQGTTWDAVFDVSIAAGSNRDAYPNIVAEPWNAGSCDHIVWMSNASGSVTVAHDPDGTSLAGRGVYSPGLAPSIANSFPGADPRMYGSTTANRDAIFYYSRGLFGASTGYSISTASNRDNEFPSIAVQGQGGPGLDDVGTRRLWVNYQEYRTGITPTDYEIVQDSATIDTALTTGSARWFIPGATTDEIISYDRTNDDFFPALAFKKDAMYWPVGRSLPWTKIAGHGSGSAASAGEKPVWFSASYEWEDPRPGDAELSWNLTHAPSGTQPTGHTMRDPLDPNTGDSTVHVYVGAAPMGTIHTPSNSMLFYRKMSVTNGAVWQSAPFSFFINEAPNEYFQASLNLSGLSPVAGDIIEYYVEINTDLKDYSASDAESTQYLYLGDLKTRMEVVAQGHPYRFVVAVPPTATPTFTPLPATDTPTNPPTDTPTPEPTATETFTPVPTDTPTLTPTHTPTSTPTDTPTYTPTDTPTFTPTNTPSPTPTPYPGENCDNPMTINCGECVSGSTVGYLNDHDCGSGHDGPDLVYAFTLPGDRWVTLIGETDFDSDWTLASTCQPNEIDAIFCVDRAGSQIDPSCGGVAHHDWGFINWSGLLTSGTYYLWIDSYYASETGGDFAFELVCDENTPTPTPTNTPTVTPTFTPTPGAGDTCSDPISLTCGSCVTGNTQWYNNDHDCGSGHAGRDVVCSFTVESDGTQVNIVSEANYDADFTLATACDNLTGDLSCVDSLAPQANPSCSSITHNTYGYFNYSGVLNAGLYYVWIDSYNTTGYGDFALELTCVIPTATPTNTPEATPTHTPTPTSTNTPSGPTPTETPIPPVPANSPFGIGITILAISLLLGTMSLRRSK